MSARRFALFVLLAGLPLLTAPAVADDPPTQCLSNPNDPDSDNDGVSDECDLCEGHNDAFDWDADTVPDGCDACPGYDDRDDFDGDGVPDDCDICFGFDDNIDGDGDGTPDGCDVCPAIANFPHGTSGAHPDAYFKDSDIPAIAASVQVAGSYREKLFDLLVFRADSHLLSNDPVDPSQLTDSVNVNSYERDLLGLAFLYLIEDEIGTNPNANDYLCQALNYVDTILAYSDWTVNAQGHLGQDALIRGVAIAYDWLYDEMGPTRRQQVLNKLDMETQAEYDALDLGSGAWYRNRTWQNHHVQAISAVGIAGYIVGDTSWSSRAEQRFDSFDGPNGYHAPDGSWHEGMHYNHVGLSATIPFLTLRKERDPFYNSFPTGGWLENTSEFIAHMTLANLRDYFYFGDPTGANNSRTPLPGTLLALTTLGSEYDLGFAQQLANQLVLPPDPDVTELSPYQVDALAILAWDDAIQRNSLRCLPTEKEYEDLGIVAIRDGWTDECTEQCNDCGNLDPDDDRSLTFKSGWPGGKNAVEKVIALGAVEDHRLNNGHEDADQNSFVYYENGEILLQDFPAKICPELGRYPFNDANPPPGCIEPPPAEPGLACTSWHNTLTLVDGTNEYGQVHPECMRVPEDDRWGDNKCNQIVADPEVLWNLFNGAGDLLVTNFSDPRYKHIDSEAHLVYDPAAPLSEFRRQIVYTSRYFVLFDRVQTTQPTTNAVFHFHTPGAASRQSSGNLTSVTYAGIDTTLVQTIFKPASIADPVIEPFTPPTHPCDPLTGRTLPPDTSVEITATSPGNGNPIDFISIFISDGSGAGVTASWQPNSQEYRIVVNTGSTTDLIRFNRTTGNLVAFLQQ